MIRAAETHDDTRMQHSLDPHALADAIGALLRDEGRRVEMAKRAKSRVAAYAPDKIASAMIDAIAPYLSQTVRTRATNR